VTKNYLTMLGIAGAPGVPGGEAPGVTKKSRRSPTRVDRAKAGLEKDAKSGRTNKTRARAMHRVAELIREVVALEKRAGGSASVYSLKRLPKARPRRAAGAKRQRRKG